MYGCCASGGKCTGDGKVVSGVSTGTATATTGTKTSEVGSSTKTDAKTTGDAPPDATPTPTAGAVAYAPGSIGALGAAVVAMLVLW